MEMAFGLQIPEDAPPVGVHHQDLLASSSPLPQSIQISQKSGTGIFYHVEASLEIVPTRRLSCVKSVESECITQELPLVIDKADLLSTWPVYKSRALSEERCSQPQDAPSQLIARRPTTAYGVGDKVSIPVHIRTREACTVTTLTLTLKEVTSTRPPPRITSPGPSSPGPVSPGLVTQSTRDIFSETFEAVMAIEPGEDHRFQLEGTIPRRHSKMTCHGDVLSITYHIRISATVEGPVRRRPKR